MSTRLNRSVEDDTRSIRLVSGIDGGEVAVEADVGAGVSVAREAGVCVAAVTNSAVDVGSDSEQADKINIVARAVKRTQVCFIRIPLWKSSELNSSR